MPAGVVVALFIVMVLVQVGVQLGCAYEAVAPVGNPDVENVTAVDVPVFKVAVMLFCID